MDTINHESQQARSGGLPAMTPANLSQPSPNSDVSQPAVSRDGETLPAQKRMLFDPRTSVLIPQGARFVGDVSAAAIYIAGELIGNAEVGTGEAVIATTGVMKGQLVAEGNVTIAGSLFNESDFCLRAAGEIDIGCHAKVTGDVYYQTLNLRRGAQVVGRLTREGD